MDKFTMFDRQVFDLFVKPDSGEVVEIRALNCFGKGYGVWNGFAKRIVSGYFDDFEKFSSSVRILKNKADELKNINIFMTLQVINPDLIARANNRLIAVNTTTSDKDVVAYRWLPIDLDPIRLSGIPSSDDELEKARQLADSICNRLASKFPPPIKAMSGNGYHLLYPLRELIKDISAQNTDTQGQVKKLLEELSASFSNEHVKVDTTLYNPSRIIKLYGTVSYKGDSVEPGLKRPGRPHRESYIYCIGDKNGG